MDRSDRWKKETNARAKEKEKAQNSERGAADRNEAMYAWYG